jgi:sigma-B regulation protein RsbU (phosphoserine phosphatase)
VNADYKSVFRRLEATLRDIARVADLSETLERLLAAITTGFGRELGVRTARIFRLDEEESHYELIRQVGDVAAPALGFRIPLDYPPVQHLRREGFLFMERGDPDLDPSIEVALEAGRFAAITVGEGAPYLVAFTLEEGFDPARVIYSLNTIRHVLNLKLRHEALSEAVQEARRIQLSLLPRQDPDFEPYDIHGRSEPAEEVGGDLFDYLPVSSKVLGVTVADASGHGLPAALQARDVITGLRMGLEDRFKIV